MNKFVKDPHQCIINWDCWPTSGQEFYTVCCSCGWEALELPSEHSLPWATTTTADAFDKWLMEHFKWQGEILIHIIKAEPNA